MQEWWKFIFEAFQGGNQFALAPNLGPPWPRFFGFDQFGGLDSPSDLVSMIRQFLIFKQHLSCQCGTTQCGTI